MALLLCLTLFAWSPARGVARQEAAETGAESGAAAMGLSFAVADFDGDSLPDFATVQPDMAMAAHMRYSIRFAFSLGRAQSFAVSAPTGGLRLASRDVNGDSFLDLIVSTRISNEPVAVLLNDGRGNFRLADTEAFGAALWETRREWCPDLPRHADGEGALASPGWTDGLWSARWRMQRPQAAGKVAIANDAGNRMDLPHEIRGRAPPAA